LLALLSVVLAYPLVTEFLVTHMVPRVPTAILASVIMVVAVVSVFSGLILDTVTRSRREIKRLSYLQYQSPRSLAESLNLQAGVCNDKSRT